MVCGESLQRSLFPMKHRGAPTFPKIHAAAWCAGRTCDGVLSLALLDQSFVGGVVPTPLQPLIQVVLYAPTERGFAYR
jgi:hypothetical protein